MNFFLNMFCVCRHYWLQADKKIPTSRYGVTILTRVEILPEEMTFFRTGGRKWKKLISSAEDLEESGI